MFQLIFYFYEVFSEGYNDTEKRMLFKLLIEYNEIYMIIICVDKTR